MKDVRYQKWVWPSIDSVDPSHRAFQVWCFSHVWFWNYSLSKVKFRHSYVRISFMYYWTPLHIASLRQLSASLWQHQEAPWPYCYTPDSRCHSCAGYWEVSLNVDQVSSLLIRQWISPYFSVDASNRFLGLRCSIQWNVQVLRSTMVQVQCLYIVWFSRYSYFSWSCPSCFVEASHLVEDIQNNSSISRTVHVQRINTRLSPNVREAPNLKRTVRGIHTIYGWSHPLPVSYIFCA